MKFLVTGGFGNVGMAVLDECLRRGHDLRAFDIPTKRNIKVSRRYARKGVQAAWGDIRKPEDVARAMEGIDAVIHLAAILPPMSDANPELCRQVNVNGIMNILEAIKKGENSAVLVEVSSASVMGPTQGRPPPVKPDDPLHPTDTYSSTKIEAERLVGQAGMRHCVLRLAGVLPTNLNFQYFLSMVKLMFDMPLQARCEIVLDIDVAHALVGAAEALTKGEELNGLRGFIAGGAENGCQLTNSQMLHGVFDQIGMPFPDDSLFSGAQSEYYLDWYDTCETQRLLCYQNHGFQDWKDIIKKKLGPYTLLIKAFRRPIQKWLESRSPLHAPLTYDGKVRRE
jgi:nucleoside-diphosphate-sugar epimerase